MGMTTHLHVRVVAAALVLTAAILAPPPVVRAQMPLAIGATRITINGTSNIHDYTATTSTVRVVRAELGAASIGDPWSMVMNPGGIAAFEVAIPAATLTSPREGLDKNMHKALKVEQHADITFRLVRVEAGETGAARAIGVLRVAGVECEVSLDVKTERTAAGLVVAGQTTLLMTDFGIKPPTAMLGMLRTDPRVTVAFETTLQIPLT